MYLISIITITFNDLNGLKKTIESIDKNYNPTIANINHIIIDGNSTDGTKIFLGNNLNERFINTIIISEPDSGIYDAMNKGVLNSSSDYVLFINSGDIVLPSFFSTEIHHYLRSIYADPKFAGLALGCLYNFNGIRIKIKPRVINKYSPKMPSLHQAIIYKKSILLKIPYSLKFKICGDFDNIARIINKYNFPIFNINIAELNAGGISTIKPLLLLNESFSIYKKYFTPNIYNKIKYLFKLSFSILIVQILFLFSRISISEKNKFLI